MELPFLLYYDTVVAALAIVANCLMLFAISSTNQAAFLRSPSSGSLNGRAFNSSKHQQQVFYRYFLISLATCDLFTSVVHILSFAFKLFVPLGNEFLFKYQFTPCDLSALLRTLQLFGFFLNLANLSAMSVDHYASVVHPVRYRNAMNESTARAIFCTIWAIAIIAVFIDLPLQLLSTKPIVLPGSSPGYSNALAEPMLLKTEALLINPTVKSTSVAQQLRRTSSNKTSRHRRPVRHTGELSSGEMSAVVETFLKRLRDEETQARSEGDLTCDAFINKLWLEVAVMSFVFVCFVLLAACYSAVFKRVSHRFIKPSQRHRLIRTTLVFIGVFSICWLPFVVFEFAMFFVYRFRQYANNSRVLYEYMMTAHFLLMSLMHSHPLLDPFIYALRVPSCKAFLVELVSKCFPCIVIETTRHSSTTSSTSGMKFGSSLPSHNSTTDFSSGRNSAMLMRLNSYREPQSFLQPPVLQATLSSSAEYIFMVRSSVKSDV